MPNAKVVGPPQAGAFKERKSGELISLVDCRLTGDIGGVYVIASGVREFMFKDQLHFENFTNEVISQLH